jgi:hypothetical protein
VSTESEAGRLLRRIAHARGVGRAREPEPTLWTAVRIVGGEPVEGLWLESSEPAALAAARREGWPAVEVVAIPIRLPALPAPWTRER